jgi:(aminoalkyl)phosphonate N-acetyltransferase
MNIRETTSADLEFVYRMMIQLEAHVIDKKQFSAVFLSNLGSNDVYYFTGELNGQPVAFISVHLQLLLHHNGKVAEVQELCVDENHRSRGFGKIMLDHVVSIAKDHDCELIELCANKKRFQAHQFYDRQGWKQSHFKYTFEFRPQPS